MAEKSNTSVIASYFGRKDGQTLAEMVEEVKQLTDEDKAQLAEGIKDESFTY